MVCLGNICRSPTAHGVLEKLIQNKGLTDSIEVESAGTSTYHLGDHPDPRSIAAARRRGYSLEQQVARQVSPNDFEEFDYVLAMDIDNLHHLVSVAPGSSKAKVQLLLDYSAGATESVPDPYFGEDGQGFEKVLDLVEDACGRLLEQLQLELSISETEL
jgi:protein-tyrosine phosphatase